jgi:hypothetical protein
MAELNNSMASFSYDGLIGGTDPQRHTKVITLASGAGSLTRGTVLGKITKGAITAAAESSNTGNGNCDTLSLGANAKVGSYTVKATAATTFSVIDPAGVRLADATAGTAYTGAINFTVTAGATAFVAGDSFTIAIAAGSEYYKKVNSANVDGSQIADCVLEYDADASSADVNATVFYSGMFNIEALTFGGTDTYATHLETLRDHDIYLTSSKGVE